MRQPSLLLAAGCVVVAAALAIAVVIIGGRTDGAAGPALRPDVEQIRRGSLAETIPALAERAERRHVPLMIPAGRYVATSTIALPAGSDVRLSAGARIVGDLPGAPLVRLASGTKLTGGTIENMATSPGFDADFAAGTRDALISGVRFAGLSVNAVYLNAPGLRNITIEDSAFDRVGYGVLLNTGAKDAVGLKIRRNIFTSVSADAVEINNATGGGVARVREVRVESNTMRSFVGDGGSSGFGVGVAGAVDVTVARNRIEGVRNEAVHLEDGTANVAVRENVIRGGGGAMPAVAIYRSTAQISVTDNAISNYHGDGVAVLWDAQGSARVVTVADNRVTQVSGVCVVLAGGRGTGPFTALDNMLVGCEAGGIGIAGGHDLSTVVGNLIEGSRGPAISQGLRGTGRTILRENSIIN